MYTLNSPSLVQFHSQTKFLNNSNCTTRDIDRPYSPVRDCPVVLNIDVCPCAAISVESDKINVGHFSWGRADALYSAAFPGAPHCAVPHASDGLNTALRITLLSLMLPLSLLQHKMTVLTLVVHSYVVSLSLFKIGLHHSHIMARWKSHNIVSSSITLTHTILSNGFFFSAVILSTMAIEVPSSPQFLRVQHISQLIIHLFPELYLLILPTSCLWCHTHSRC